jgi:hypothetical protein
VAVVTILPEYLRDLPRNLDIGDDGRVPDGRAYELDREEQSCERADRASHPKGSKHGL